MCVACTLFLVVGTLPVATATPSVNVTSSVITTFVPGSQQRVFGKLEFLGGFEYTSSDRRVGGVSSIRFRSDGRQFVAVLDTGEWMAGAITRDGNGHLTGLADVTVLPILDRKGAAGSKSDMDAEGLALWRDEVVVSFERRHRIHAFPDPDFAIGVPRTLDMVIPKQELRSNGGIETVAAAPDESPLRGALVAVAERSIDAEGNLFAAILDGPLKGIFKVAKNEPWAVTDGAFLPGGDLLLLERRFSFTGGVGMRIRRISGDTIHPGALVDGEVLIEAAMGAEIDNMEGLDVVPAPDGDLRIIIVSDDNKSFLQRNLMLEFRLVE
ncbi:MAG: esterase-like activity of phytase family protein [Pseudorhizobium sp.]